MMKTTSSEKTARRALFEVALGTAAELVCGVCLRDYADQEPESETGAAYLAGELPRFHQRFDDAPVCCSWCQTAVSA